MKENSEFKPVKFCFKKIDLVSYLFGNPQELTRLEVRNENLFCIQMLLEVRTVYYNNGTIPPTKKKTTYFPVLIQC